MSERVGCRRLARPGLSVRYPATLSLSLLTVSLTCKILIAKVLIRHCSTDTQRLTGPSRAHLIVRAVTFEMGRHLLCASHSCSYICHRLFLTLVLSFSCLSCGAVLTFFQMPPTQGKPPKGPASGAPPSAVNSRSSSRQTVLSRSSSAGSLTKPPYSPFDKRGSSAASSARSTPRLPTPKGRHVIPKYDPTAPPFRPITEGDEGTLSAVTSRTSSRDRESAVSTHQCSLWDDSPVISRNSSLGSSASRGRVPLVSDPQFLSRTTSTDSVSAANAEIVQQLHEAALVLVASATTAE